MATKYTVIDTVGQKVVTVARKDNAIKKGEATGQPFQVVTDTGAVVHDAIPTQSTEAPAPAEKKEPTVASATATKPKATAKKAAAPAPKAEASAKTGPSNELEFSHGAKYFFRQMGASAVQVAEARELTATLEKGNVISVSGGDAKTRKTVVKEIDQFLTAQYAAFKEWKKGLRDNRREWYGTPEGRKAMTEAETEFFDSYAARYIAGEVDEAEGVI